MTRPSRRLRQFVAVGLLALVLAAAIFAVAMPLNAHVGALQDSVAARQALLMRYRAAIAGLQTTEGAGVQPLPADVDSYFLQGEIVSIALAGLQSNLNDMAGDAGIRFTSLSTIPLQDANGLRLVGAQVFFQARIAALQQLIHAIESSRPLLVVSNLSIRATGDAPQPQDLDPAGNPGEPSPERILDVQFIVQGAMKTVEPAQ